MAGGSTADIIAQLNHARNICLADPNNLYPQIVPGLQPVIKPDAPLELRRWGTNFYAETFASPVLAGEHKQKLSVQILDALKGYLDNKSEDATVVKNVVQTAASIYPFVFRHIMHNPNDAATWQKMAGIKSNILRRMDNEPPGVRICCVKFIQSVVQAQTPGMIADPRRPDQNEISLALVPRDHPVIPPSNLEAEASGLLDRLLGVIQDNSSEALMVTATLNSLGSLVRSRASIANKIVSTILNFNPFTLAQAHSPMTAKDKVLIRSMTRTTMNFLANIIKRNPNHPLSGRIQGTIDRLRHSLVEVFDETSRKRPAPAEPTDGLSDAKRQRLGAGVPAHGPTQAKTYPSLPPGPVTFAQLFTLTDDQGARGFDVKAIPLDLVMRVVPPLLSSIDRGQLDNAINAVRARYLKLTATTPIDASSASRAALGTDPTAVDEDDDYEPDYPFEDREQVLNDLDQSGKDDTVPFQQPEVALATFDLPPPPPLSDEEAIDHTKGAVGRVFGTLSVLDRSTAAGKPNRHGFNRLAASNHDRDGWITMISRLATRTAAGPLTDHVKSESKTVVRRDFSAANAIRDALYLYIIDDFRRRIDVAITWLNEEWYNDRITRQQYESEDNLDVPEPESQYNHWLHKILDGFLPFLDAKDRLLIRFVSEIPALDRSVVQRVVKLAADPERVNLAVQAIYYLVLYRPPVREICIDGLEDLWRNYDDAKPTTRKLLVKWRPGVIEESQANGDAVAPTAVKVES